MIPSTHTTDGLREKRSPHSFASTLHAPLTRCGNPRGPCRAAFSAPGFDWHTVRLLRDVASYRAGSRVTDPETTRATENRSRRLFNCLYFRSLNLPIIDTYRLGSCRRR